MSLISAALTLFALVMILAQVQRRSTLALAIGGLLVALYVLPEAGKVAAPLVAILTLGLGESIASLRPR
jgi:hypothetical protein